MNHPVPSRAFAGWKHVALALLVLGGMPFAETGIATTRVTSLPATHVGRLSGELLRHMNDDSALQLRRWLPGILSPSIGKDDQADFIANLASGARDAGGVDLYDVQTDPRQPGLLEVVLKGRRSQQLGLLVLMADPVHPEQLARANIMPMDDPALFVDWPTKGATRAVLPGLVHDALDRLVKTSDFSGCVTVTTNDTTLFDECRGLAERNFAAPVNARTRFHIGSMDKMFTAVAIAQLVESGKLSWDSTLAALVPDYPDARAAKDITVWQLLHHTAGLGDFLVPEYFEHREAFVDPADYLDLIARQPKVAEPGKQWAYSNAGYMLLGRIIENVSHEGYFDYMEHHVFAPALMRDSGFDRLDDVTPNLATGYFRDGVFSTRWKAAWMKLGVIGGPAGGGYSTNADLLRFAKALRSGKLVKGATVAKMFDAEVPAGPGGYAAGFGDRTSHDVHIRGHAGGIEGTTSNLLMVWEADATVVLTSNEGPTQTWMLAEHIADLLAADHASR